MSTFLNLNFMFKKYILKGQSREILDPFCVLKLSTVYGAILNKLTQFRKLFQLLSSKFACPCSEWPRKFG